MLFNRSFGYAKSSKVSGTLYELEFVRVDELLCQWGWSSTNDSEANHPSEWCFDASLLMLDVGNDLSSKRCCTRPEMTGSLVVHVCIIWPSAESGACRKHPLRFYRIRRARISPDGMEIHWRMFRVHNACSVGKGRQSFAWSRSVSG